jgi:hypothetical protein
VVSVVKPSFLRWGVATPGRLLPERRGRFHQIVRKMACSLIKFFLYKEASTVFPLYTEILAR